MKKKTDLRTGYTTGTCAAVAAKGALLSLLGVDTADVEIDLPGGQKVRIAPAGLRHNGDSAVCEVVKDAGDDPDVTNGAVIRALVKLSDSRSIIIKAGEGVGIVTRPGLAVPPGEPAINPVPRKMIQSALKDILPPQKGVEVFISVAGGEQIAGKTLNHRLGIVGGISILGTTGLVLPYSHEAYRESIICALDVVRAMGLDVVVLSTGRKSEKIARAVYAELPEPAFVLMADHFSFAVGEAVKHGIKKIILSCFPGKLLKIAAGAQSTHYSKSSVDLRFLADIAEKEALGSKVQHEIAAANTVRHAFALIPEVPARKVCAHISQRVTERIKRDTADAIRSEVLIVSYNDKILFQG